jgi:hypothetical protein
MEIRYKLDRDGKMVGNGEKTIAFSYPDEKNETHEVHLGGKADKGEIAGAIIPDSNLKAVEAARNAVFHFPNFVEIVEPVKEEPAKQEYVPLNPPIHRLKRGK